jgi:hypothetical protein
MLAIGDSAVEIFDAHRVAGADDVDVQRRAFADAHARRRAHRDDARGQRCRVEFDDMQRQRALLEFHQRGAEVRVRRATIRDPRDRAARVRGNRAQRGLQSDRRRT